jgi:hypothetical protein
MWKQSRVGRAFSTDYRGIRIKITVDPKTDKPTEISWYISGKLAESSPVTCTLEVAKQIAVQVVDHQIETDAQWAITATFGRSREGLGMDWLCPPCLECSITKRVLLAVVRRDGQHPECLVTWSQGHQRELVILPRL